VEFMDLPARLREIQEDSTAAFAKRAEANLLDEEWSTQDGDSSAFAYQVNSRAAAIETLIDLEIRRKWKNDQYDATSLECKVWLTSIKLANVCNQCETTCAKYKDESEEETKESITTPKSTAEEIKKVFKHFFETECQQKLELWIIDTHRA
jgi:hypothetical protein